MLRLKGEVEEKRRKKAENGSASGPEADAGGDPSPPPGDSDPDASHATADPNFFDLSAPAQLTRALRQLHSSLSSLRSSETHYRLTVEDDNSSTLAVEAGEAEALRGLEELEGERLRGVVDGCARIAQAESGAIGNMRSAVGRVGDSGRVLPLPPLSATFAAYISPPSGPPSSLLTPPPPTERLSPTTIARRRALADNHHPISASVQAEADACNLSPMVAQLRSDEVRGWKRLTASKQALESLRRVVIDVSRSSLSYGSSVSDALRSHGYPSADASSPHASAPVNTSLGAAAASAHAPNAAAPPPPADDSSLLGISTRAEGRLSSALWSCVASRLVSGAADAGRALREDLDAVVGGGGKGGEPPKLGQQRLNDLASHLKASKESADAVWRSMCDHGKSQARAESRQKTAEIGLNAARERLSGARAEYERDKEIMDVGGSGEPENFAGVRKAIGHVLTSLGTGDDTLSKVVTAKERMEMATAAFQRAEAQLRDSTAALEEANERGATKLRAYVAHFEEAFKGLREREADAEAAAGAALRAAVAALEAFLDGREKAVKEVARVVEKVRAAGVQSDKVTWARKMERKISRKNAEAAKLRRKEERGRDADGSEGGDAEESVDDEELYSISVRLRKSRVCYELLMNVFDYKPEDFDWQKLSDEDSRTVSVVIDLLGSIKMENDATAEEKKSAGGAKQKEQLTFERNFEGMFVEEAPSPVGGADGAGKGEGGEGAEGEGRQQDAEGGGEDGGDGAGTSAASAGGEGGSGKGAPPTVIESFSCAYWTQSDDKTSIASPLLHGRMFVTAAAIYFVGWGKFKLILELEDIVETRKESTAMGAVDNALLLVCSDGKEYFFGSFAFRENCHRLIDRLRSVKGALIDAGMVLPSTTLKKRRAGDDEDGDEDGGGGGGGDDDDDETSSAFIPHDLPPDEQVKKMTVVVSDTLRGINIGQFFNSFWRDKPGSEFYGPWLETKKSEKVKVGGWEKNRHEHKFSKEVFSHKRVATFDYPRTTHLWVGPPMAGVTQAHYARIDDGARCIIAMSVEMNGIPYADVFAVEVRWVATNVADRVIEIEVGVAVDFKKSSMFKGQIRSGTEEETGAIHMSLFEEMKRRVGEMAAEAGEELEQEAGPGAAEGAVVVREEKVVVAAGGWLGEKGFLAVLLVAFAVVFWDLHQQKRLVRELMVNTAELQEDIRALVKELERKMIQ